MRLLPATLLVLGALGAVVGCGDRESEAPAALPPSGTAYRKLDDGDRLAVAAGCRDRAAAQADGAAATELARVDPQELRDELDAAFALVRHQPRAVVPTQRLRKIANNTFTLSFDVPPSAPREAYFTALCLDCLAGAAPSSGVGR